MKINRLFGIVYYLMEQKRTTAKELACHFEVSHRTILRDIDHLTMAGIPIYTSKGKGGGIFIFDQFILNKTTLSETEQKEILFALESLSPTQQLDFQETRTKLSQFFHREKMNWIEVDFSRWGSESKDKEKFQKIKDVILQKKKVKFTYISSYGEETKREVLPYKLRFKSKSWYLEGVCLAKEANRLFKLNRMTNLVESSYFCEGQKASQQEASNPQLTEKGINLQLEFSSKVGYRLYDDFPPETITKTNHGNYLVKTCMPEDEWLYTFLLSFGSNVRIIEPQHVFTSIKNKVTELYHFYHEI